MKIQLNIARKVEPPVLTFDEKEEILFTWDKHAHYNHIEGVMEQSGCCFVRGEMRQFYKMVSRAEVWCLNADRTEREKYRSLDLAVEHLIESGCVTVTKEDQTSAA